MNYKQQHFKTSRKKILDGPLLYKTVSERTETGEELHEE